MSRKISISIPVQILDALKYWHYATIPFLSLSFFLSPFRSRNTYLCFLYIYIYIYILFFKLSIDLGKLVPSSVLLESYRMGRASSPCTNEIARVRIGFAYECVTTRESVSDAYIVLVRGCQFSPSVYESRYDGLRLRFSLRRWNFIRSEFCLRFRSERFHRFTSFSLSRHAHRDTYYNLVYLPRFPRSRETISTVEKLR